jgi:hypothetical protein
MLLFHVIQQYHSWAYIPKGIKVNLYTVFTAALFTIAKS